MKFIPSMDSEADKLKKAIAHTTHFYGPNINFFYNSKKVTGYRRTVSGIEVIHYLKA